MSKCFPGNAMANEIAVNTFTVVTIIIITIDGINYHVIACFNIKTNIKTNNTHRYASDVICKINDEEIICKMF